MLKKIRNCCGAICSLFQCKKKKKKEPIICNLQTPEQLLPGPQMKTPEAGKEIETQAIVEPLDTVEKNVVTSEVDAADEEVSSASEYFSAKSLNLQEEPDSEELDTTRSEEDLPEDSLIQRVNRMFNRPPPEYPLLSACSAQTKALAEKAEPGVSSVFQERPGSAHQTSFTTISDFKVYGFLGSGCFGEVFQAQHKKTGKMVAIKRIDKEEYFEEEMVKNVFVERDILRLARKTRCPFLVSSFCAFQSEHHAFLAMEFAVGGSLASLLETGALTQESTLFYAACIVLGIKFLHDRGIIHRDLKPANVLIDSAGYAKLADFGICKTGIDDKSKIYELCGDMFYTAPEVLRGEGYNWTVDWWIFGITIYQMAVAKLPFTGDDEELFNKILYTEPDYPSDLDSSTISVIQALLDKDPRFRLGSEIDDGEEVQRCSYFKSIDWNALWNKQLKAPFKPSQTFKTDGNEEGFKFAERNWTVDQDVQEAFRNFDELPEEYS
ncbi:hypothetical protein XELAEV_18041127mg [Xenopus laevis]|uniref:Uncharacterized protein n=1 Tax=Xenopus laevis TaxID=8355 RepID=A0A974C2U5_XENLA|nr:hypothetical protein XELAEV_18041127mg [Xenopus laevis]